MQQPVIGCLPCLRSVYKNEACTQLLGKSDNTLCKRTGLRPTGQAERGKANGSGFDLTLGDAQGAHAYVHVAFVCEINRQDAQLPPLLLLPNKN